MPILTGKAGYVYVIRCQQFYKIGVSKHPDRRSWETDNPFDIEIVCLFSSQQMRKTEMRLHEMFRRFHHRGEWFLLPDACVTWLQTITDIDATAAMWGHETMKQLIRSF